MRNSSCEVRELGKRRVGINHQSSRENGRARLRARGFLSPEVFSDGASSGAEEHSDVVEVLPAVPQRRVHFNVDAVQIKDLVYDLTSVDYDIVDFVGRELEDVSKESRSSTGTSERKNSRFKPAACIPRSSRT